MLKQFSVSGELDVRGVRISDALLKEILDAAPHNAADKPAFSAIQFDRATFEGDATFYGATFEGNASFDGATFEGGASFYRATFEGGARFSKARFEGNAGFSNARFEGELGSVLFDEASFKGIARFNEASFKGIARFDGATFEGDAGFDEARFEGGLTQIIGARFEGNAGFSKARLGGKVLFYSTSFKGITWFQEARFGRDTRFYGATFEGDASFDEVRFEGDVPVLGPITVGGTLLMDGVQFASAVRIETDANALTCRRGRFSGGVRFDVRRAVIHFEDSDFSVPSLLTGPRRPKLSSLQGANVAGLTLGNVNLTDCRFAGAHNLDELRLEADAVFGLSPAVAGWERRQVIAEEAAWRERRWVVAEKAAQQKHDQVTTEKSAWWRGKAIWWTAKAKWRAPGLGIIAGRSRRGHSPKRTNRRC